MSQNTSVIERNLYGSWIDGAEQLTKEDDPLLVVDPGTEKELTEVSTATEADVDEAVSAAQKAFESWHRRPPYERGQILNNIATAVRDENENLARLITLETGRPFKNSIGVVERVARYFEYYAGIADKIQGESIPLGESYADYTIHEPLGVTAHIVPWNAPLFVFARSAAPALAAGNAVVAKPDEKTPLSTLKFAEITSKVDFPDGLLNVIPGYGDEAGAALTSHPEVNDFTFTGSINTGIEVAKSAIENVTKSHLELGGKSPNVIFSDADMEAALVGATMGIFSNAGQICAAGSRLLIHEEIHEEFVADLVERAEALKIGPGFQDPDMGPLISAEHIKKVEEYIEIGRKEVGEPITGGERLDRDGYFIEPTIFDNVPHNTRIAQEEIFGPVLTVTTFDDESEAFELANKTDYGLDAGIYTQDVSRAHRFAREVDAGQIYINEFYAGGHETPFGGYERSGIGRMNGVQAIKNYTQVKNVCANINHT